MGPGGGGPYSVKSGSLRKLMPCSSNDSWQAFEILKITYKDSRIRPTFLPGNIKVHDVNTSRGGEVLPSNWWAGHCSGHLR